MSTKPNHQPAQPEGVESLVPSDVKEGFSGTYGDLNNDYNRRGWSYAGIKAGFVTAGAPTVQPYEGVDI